MQLLIGIVITSIAIAFLTSQVYGFLFFGIALIIDVIVDNIHP